jgi:hypothetical protein
MRKKELHSMMRHRGLSLGLALAALLGLSAQKANAAPMTLTVLLDGTEIFTTSGNDTSVTANVTVLNASLAGTGYTFSNLGGSSNFPGSNTLAVGGFIADSGNLSREGGTGGVLTIIVTEDGFTAPAGGFGANLFSSPTATFAGTTAGTSFQTDMGTFTPGGGGASVSTAEQTLASNGTPGDSHSVTVSTGIPSYVTPYTLALTQTISLTQRSTISAATDSIGGTVTVLAVVPEPASLIMMVTGMPLPLVVMGLLRRRRAAAAA